MSATNTRFVDFFIEIFSEEIPARMQKSAVQNFEALFLEAFNAHGIVCQNAKVFITPQRMVFKADITENTKSISEERRGPKISAPDKALGGFLKSVGLSKDKLTIKNEYYYACMNTPEKDAKNFIPSILESVLRKMSWPKVMRYPGASLSWVRPIRHVVCSFNNLPMHFDLPYLGLTTASYTKGHRFLSPKNIAITSFKQYKSDLENAYVVLDQQKRRTIILQQLERLAAGKKLRLNLNEKLLDEVTGLCEFPVTYVRSINKEFMNLPECVLTTSMTYHQKYFSFLNAGGSLAPYFGVVVNNQPPCVEKMLQGYESVLKARLSDAAFFFETDVKVSLHDLLPKLKTVLFQDKLGTVYDKIQRLLLQTDNKQLKEAIQLSKSDLVTLMVGEFPELQGRVGHLYALKQGVSAEVAQCIEDHYLPQGVHDDLPHSQLAKQLAVMDKMDSIVGLFGVGLTPTGSKDPFALRRQALGIIRIVLTDGFVNFNMNACIESALQQYENSGVKLEAETLNNVKTFILERFYHYMKDAYAHDSIKAVTSTMTDACLNLWSLSKRIEAFNAFSKTEAGVSLQQSYRRAKGVCDDVESSTVQSSLFQTQEEDVLFAQLGELDKNIQPLLNAHDYKGAMKSLTQVQEPINVFFENVMVNVEDKKVADNRKALLKMFTSEVQKIADF